MDIFSLINLETKDADDNGVANDEDSMFSKDTDGFVTPRDSEWSSPLSTPRSSTVLSTSPQSPARTPPRPTSHIDDRIRMRRFKLSMSPSPSPSPSPTKSRRAGDDMLSSDPLDDSPPFHRRPMDSTSFSSAIDDWDEPNKGGSFSSTPNATPNNSPRRGDLLSLSPIQQRLDRARTKRQQILEERVQNIDTKSREKEQQAIKRKEDATLQKIEKAARTEESINQAKSKRQQILEDRVHQIDVKSKLKEEGAIRRKEGKTLEVIEKCRTELAKPPVVREKRDQQLALKIEDLEATLESKTTSAQTRLEHHLYEKQQRASHTERKERAERRRKLTQYEKHANILAALDAKLERAALKTHQINEEKSNRAGENIANAKEVSRRVRAARVIQANIRKVYGIEGPPNCDNLDLSQHAAAERLQRWFQWRARVCKRRLMLVGSDESDDNASTYTAINALEQLLELFPLETKHSQHQQQRRPSSVPPFELLSHKMMQPETLQLADQIVDCFRPINEVSFGSSTTKKSSPTKMDGRTLLSLCLIAIHPNEVLGVSQSTNRDEDKGSKMLVSKSKKLLQVMKDLLMVLKEVSNENESDLAAKGSDTESRALKSVSEVSHSLAELLKQVSKHMLIVTQLFEWWKKLDMEELLAGLSTQLEQSWVVYLTSSETLKYLIAKTGSGSATNEKNDDPLMSLRIRHEASRSGSRSHIKRIRVSLNKLIGNEEAKEVVTSAKSVAVTEIDENNIMDDLKGEIDEILGSATTIGEAEAGAGASEQSDITLSVDLPDELVSNRVLVHKIMLTDSADFDKLSWDGTNNAQSPCMGPEEFMAMFAPQSLSSNNSTAGATEDIPMHIAQSMRTVFFNQVATEMEQGNYDPIQCLLKELHTKMKSLLPSRQDLHLHLNDEDTSSCSTTSDAIRVLIRAGYLLANYLESAARAHSTRELIECLELCNSVPHDDNAVIPYGVESEELLAVASTANILYKAELCQIDVSNFKLSQAAPLLHTVGNEYERKHFQKIHGDYSSLTIEELQHTLPSTWNWIKGMQNLHSNSENLTHQSNLEQKLDFVRGRGFVDGILFTRSQLALPEFLSLDVDSINHIRSEARCCVIASALALHACNISKVGSSVLNLAEMSVDVNDARQALLDVLGKTHFDQTELEASVLEAISSLARALTERDITEEEVEMLKNHTIAVLHGKDPVLKLLDHRVQTFFRFACKWKSHTTSSSTAALIDMKTGRSVLKETDSIASRHGIKSTKNEFNLAAKKEASRLGFVFFGSALIGVGDEARGIISLACTNYGEGILDRFMSVVGEENE